MDRKLGRRLSTLYFLFYMPVGLCMPYLYLYFERRGMAGAQLGTLAAVTPVMNALMPPLWGALADRWGDRRWVLAALLTASAFVYPWLMVAESYGQMLALTIVFAMFYLTPAPIADAIVMENIECAGGDYGKLRLWGSIGFAAPLLLLGGILKAGPGGSAESLHPTFLGFSVFRLLAAAWVMQLPPSRAVARTGFRWDEARVFLSARFLTYALCGMLAIGSIMSYYVFFTIYLDEVGIGDSAKGYFWVIAVAAETAMMLVIGRVIGRIGVKWTFALGIFGCVVRLLAFSFYLAPLGIAAAQTLHALTMTALFVSAITAVSRISPPHLRATGQSLWVAFTGGLGAAVASKMAGVAMGALGLTGMFRIFSGAAAVALVIAVLFVREPQDLADD